MARNGAGDSGRWFPLWLHAVLARGVYRGAFVGMALAVFSRRLAGTAGCRDSLRHQREPAFSARLYRNDQARFEPKARSMVAGAPVSARNADRIAGLFFLLVYLD